MEVKKITQKSTPKDMWVSTKIAQSSSSLLWVRHLKSNFCLMIQETSKRRMKKSLEVPRSTISRVESWRRPNISRSNWRKKTWLQMKEIETIRLKVWFLRTELTVNPKAKRKRDYKSLNLISKRSDNRNNKWNLTRRLSLKKPKLLVFLDLINHTVKKFRSSRLWVQRPKKSQKSASTASQSVSILGQMLIWSVKSWWLIDLKDLTWSIQS